MNYANGSNAAFGIRRTSLLPVFHFRPSLRGGLKHVAVSSDSPVKTHRALVFPVTWQSPLLDWLLREFRLLVNESIRIALKEDINLHGPVRPAQCVAPGAEIGWARCSSVRCATGRWIVRSTQA